MSSNYLFIICQFYYLLLSISCLLLHFSFGTYLYMRPSIFDLAALPLLVNLYIYFISYLINLGLMLQDPTNLRIPETSDKILEDLQDMTYVK